MANNKPKILCRTDRIYKLEGPVHKPFYLMRAPWDTPAGAHAYGSSLGNAGDVILRRHGDKRNFIFVLGQDPTILRGLGEALIDMAGNGWSEPTKETVAQTPKRRPASTTIMVRHPPGNRYRVPVEKPITTIVNAEKYWDEQAKCMPPVRAALREGGMVAVLLNKAGLREVVVRNRLYYAGKPNRNYKDGPSRIKVQTTLVERNNPDYDENVGRGHEYVLAWGA